MEKVSIIVPVYNAEKYIARCVRSILDQDYREIELILVDDESKDESGKMLDAFALEDQRVKVIHKANGGVSSTRNRGLEEATGRYVQFVDADDSVAKEATKLLVRTMETDSCDLVVADFHRVIGEAVSHKGSISKSGLLSRREYADQMMKSPADLYYGVIWNKLYRRSIIEEHHITMDENITISEDMIFNLEYLLHSATVSVLTVPVYYYNMTPGSLVIQNTNLPKVMEMKTNVISYYNKFYKETLSPADYIERVPSIYGYLLAVSKDSLVLNPFKKKEKQENVLLTSQKHSLLLDNYLGDLLLNKHLKILEQKYSIDSKECRILYLLHLSEQPMRISQLAELMETSFVQAGIAIGKLLSLKYVKREYVHRYDAFVDEFSLANDKLVRDLAYMEEDLESIVFKGMNKEKRELYFSLEAEINRNVQQNLSKE